MGAADWLKIDDAETGCLHLMVIVAPHLTSPLINQGSQQSGPGLMGSPQAFAAIRMKIFMKKNVLFPIRIGLEVLIIPVNGPTTLCIDYK